MEVMLAGMVLFYLTHALHLFAPAWRERQVARLGLARWQAGYALVALLGLGLMVWGYGATRHANAWWEAPQGLRHVTALLSLAAFVVLGCGSVKGSRLGAWIGHPMVAATALWALGHLLVNGRPGDVLLFGSFLIWSAASFCVHRARDRAAGRRPAAGILRADLIGIGFGLVVAAVFSGLLHEPLFGVAPGG